MLKFNISIPDGALLVLTRLEEKGHEAYVVGGCVRDSLMGKTPEDWDVTTSASPQEIIDVFKGEQVILTGLKHGTVTVRLKSKNYEITSFRSEGEYLDSRHPSSVSFVKDIKEDLKRRDFTINAMAYSPKRGLIDLYEGVLDIERGIIRAVGCAKERFEEDALRILRGVRFVSVTGFEIEENTLKAMNERATFLKKISAERVFVELDKLLVGEFVFKALTIAPQVIFEVIPELKKCYNFNQHSKWHSLDVYNHIARAVSSIKPKQELRWCMLFHDVAKPDKFFLDENGEGHFYGHADLSEKVAYGILKRLKASNKLIENVCFLVKNHDKPFPQNDLKFKLRLAEIGEKNALDLVDVKYADNMAQGTIKSSEERQNIAKLESKIKEVIKTCDCINIKQLKVDGNDVVAYGFKGRQVGDVLQKLFVDVLAGNIKNEREKLLKSIEKRAKTRL
ncbi:MAG: CCA tRNA nucleotidyltransferase [Clostridia bacterium]|nr:CCA tRNA nucleotidyltransferase [Clostridia bacterium]